MTKPINSKKKSPLQLAGCKKAENVNLSANNQNLPQTCPKSKQGKKCQILAKYQRGKHFDGLTLKGNQAMALYELNHPAGGGTDTQTTRVPKLPQVIKELQQQGYRIQKVSYIAQGKDQKRYWLLDKISNMFVQRHG